MISTINERTYEFRGSSSLGDVPPIGNNCVNNTVNYPISNGSIYRDMDTSKLYMLKLTPNVDDEGKTQYTGAWVEVTFKI